MRFGFPFKLVRDKVPDLIQQRTGWCVTKELKGKDFRRALAAKVIEEARELSKSETEEEITNELADLVEVTEAFRVAHAIREQDLRAARAKRSYIRGVFKKGIKLMFWIGNS